jgi:hypothetical protein
VALSHRGSDSAAGTRAGLGRPRGDALAGAAGGLADLATAPVGDTAIEPPPDSFDGPAEPAAPPADLAGSGRVVASGGTWAVMIGINNYPGSRHDLRSAVADANDVNEALARMGVPGDHRLLVRDGQASGSVVGRAADWLVAHAGPDAVAVFFYAGHVRKLSSGTEAIVAADGGVVTDAQLASRLRPLQARRAWIGLASCYGGGFTELLGPGRVLSAAAGANSLAYENASFGRSYMVQFMVREAMIDNRAPGSVQDSFNYARAEISRQYPGREPVEIDQAGAPLSLRPVGAGPAPAPKPKPASGAAASSQPSQPAPQQPPPQSPPPGGGSGGAANNCKVLTLGVVRCSDG